MSEWSCVVGRAGPQCRRQNMFNKLFTHADVPIWAATANMKPNQKARTCILRCRVASWCYHVQLDLTKMQTWREQNSFHSCLHCAVEAFHNNCRVNTAGLLLPKGKMTSGFARWTKGQPLKILVHVKRRCSDILSPRSFLSSSCGDAKQTGHKKHKGDGKAVQGFHWFTSSLNLENRVCCAIKKLSIKIRHLTRT